MAGDYPQRVLAAIAAHGPVMGLMDSPSVAVIQHVSQHTDQGDVRLDSCPCARGVEGLPTDDIGRPVLEQLGEGQYLSSARHTLADLVRDVISA